MDAAVAVRRVDRRDRRLSGIDYACAVVATALKDREILLILPILPLPSPPCISGEAPKSASRCAIHPAELVGLSFHPGEFTEQKRPLGFAGLPRSG
jgi:hypothetical protein